jgi:hypothetical protein
MAHLDQTRHAIHEYHGGELHKTGWNINDMLRFPRYMAFILGHESHLKSAKGVYLTIASK